MQEKKKPDAAELDTNAHHWILEGTLLKKLPKKPGTI
jgi:hypothetical protein